MKHRKNAIWRAVLLLMALAILTTSVAFGGTQAKYAQYIDSGSKGTFEVFHFLSFKDTNQGHDNKTNASVTFSNVPAGEWAFFARGTNGRDASTPGVRGKGAIFLGLYTKAVGGYFTIASIKGGNRHNGSVWPWNYVSGSGGAAACIFDEVSMTTVTGRTGTARTTANIVVVAGGGGGGGEDARGGDAGGQTGLQSTSKYVNGIPGATEGTVSNGIVHGWQANSSGAGNQQSQNRSRNNGGGGGGSTTQGGQAGNVSAGSGSDGDWFVGGDARQSGTYASGGGGAGLWGGGGASNRGDGGGGASYSAATGAVPAAVTSPSTYREHAIAYFWSLVNDINGLAMDTTAPSGAQGTVILVWLGPV